MRLRAVGSLWVVAGFAAGLAAAALWGHSLRMWDRHLTRAQIAGLILYDALGEGRAPPPGVVLTRLDPAAARLAEAGAFDRLEPGLRPAYVTNLSLLTDSANPIGGAVLTLRVVSDDLRYPVSGISAGRDGSAPEKLGQLTRMLAAYCSEPVLFARFGERAWQRVDGRALWGCAAAPADLRLPAALLAAFALAVLLSHVGQVSAAFDTFAQALRGRRRLGGPEAYESDGPDELREIVAAVNSYLEAERDQLAKRAVVLSGVSHDLGTPATRLRLRAALIADEELRSRLEADIDRMTGMIESVLTYTRSELNLETPRQISLSALLDAVVADYQDTGRPVTLREAAPLVVEGGHSVFLARRRQQVVAETRPVLVTARPIALSRALSNLIDNALKYGRRATVSLEARAERVAILVEDEGQGCRAAEMEALMAPFRRGANAATSDGFGLGLTIAATVAEQHGGSLRFEDGERGLRARLELQRV